MQSKRTGMASGMEASRLLSPQTPRSTAQVFEDHLRLRLEGRLEDDLRRNYAEDVVLLTVNSNARGHDAIRMSADRLVRQLPDSHFEFVKKQVNGRFAMLVWRATSARFSAVGGADGFVIEDGLIRLQTIHYQFGHGTIENGDFEPLR